MPNPFDANATEDDPSKIRIRLKRVYDPPESDDGTRILVDRLWPRGVSRETAGIDVWLKEAAPSNALRMKVHADPGFPQADPSWRQFVGAYERELAGTAGEAALRTLAGLVLAGPVTLLYAGRDRIRNNAAALISALQTHWPKDLV